MTDATANIETKADSDSQDYTPTPEQIANRPFETDTDFRTLLRPLTVTEYKALEAGILQAKKATVPLVVWKEEKKLIDGYNRLSICEKHNLKYKVSEKSFPSRDAVKLWIYENQDGRRNTSEFDRVVAVLKIKDTLVEDERKRRSSGGKSCKNFYTSGRVNAILGDKAGVSHVLVGWVEFIMEKFRKGVISQEEIDGLSAGKLSPSGIYKRYYVPKSRTKSNGEIDKDLSDQQENEVLESNVELQAVTELELSEGTVSPAHATVEESREFIDQSLDYKISSARIALDGIVDGISDKQDAIKFLYDINKWATAKKFQLE